MRCKQTKSNGEQCKMAAMPGKVHCWRHSPDISSHIKKAASAKGGQNRKLDLSMIDTELNISSTKDISALLVDTIRNIRKGIFDPRMGNAIGYLAYILVRTHELTEVEDRLIQLEDRLDNFDYLTVTPEFKRESDKTEITQDSNPN